MAEVSTSASQQHLTLVVAFLFYFSHLVVAALLGISRRFTMLDIVEGYLSSAYFEVSAQTSSSFLLSNY